MTPYYNIDPDFNDPQGTHEALAIKFSLKKGCYATMVLRELVKVDSGLDA